MSNRDHCSDSERFISTCKDLQEHGRHPKSLQDSLRRRYCVPLCVPRFSGNLAKLIDWLRGAAIHRNCHLDRAFSLLPRRRLGRMNAAERPTNGLVDSQTSDADSIPIARSINPDDSNGLTWLSWLNPAQKRSVLDCRWTEVQSIGPNSFSLGWNRRSQGSGFDPHRPYQPMFPTAHISFVTKWLELFDGRQGTLSDMCQ